MGLLKGRTRVEPKKAKKRVAKDPANPQSRTLPSARSLVFAIFAVMFVGATSDRPNLKGLDN